MPRTTIAQACLALATLAAISSAATSLSGCTKNASDGRDTIAFTIDGMACPNCAKHIEHELEAIPGVKAARVDFASKTARVTTDPNQPATREQLDAAVAAWKKEHFAAEEDPECLDPAKRAEIKRAESEKPVR